MDIINTNPKMNPKTNPEAAKAFRDLASFINVSTGRGTTSAVLSPFNGPWATALLYSPRFLTSRIEYWPRVAQAIATGAPATRKMAIKQLVGKAAIFGGLAGLAKVASEAFDWDVEVPLDPRDPRFLKIAFGEGTTVDMAAGYGQVFKLIAQVATDSQIKNARVVQKDWRRTVTNFGRNKLAPLPSLLVSLKEGRTPGGEDISLAHPMNIVNQLITPIPFETLVEVTREHGATGLLLMAPETVGFGVNIFKPR
jgi:hypothetical protein